MEERGNKTIMCSVLFLDIVEYSKKSVAGQISLKDRFNDYLSAAIRDVPVADRIILDTGDGAAINFLGDVEDALKAALSLRESLLNEEPDLEHPLLVRMGINLGPVRLVRDINGQPNIVGDGINVAQRVMGFADASQILVSRSYFDAVSRLSPTYAGMFHYQGSRTDKHVREHEIYAIGYPGDQTAKHTEAGAITGQLAGRYSALVDTVKLGWGAAAGKLDAFAEGQLARYRKADSKQRAIYIAALAAPVVVLIAGVALKVSVKEEPTLPTAVQTPVVGGEAQPLANKTAVAKTEAPALGTTEAKKTAESKTNGTKANGTKTNGQAKHPQAQPKVKQVESTKPADKGSAEPGSEAYVVVSCKEGTQVFVDGSQKGKVGSVALTVPISPATKHTVIVSHPGGGIYTQNIELAANRTLRIRPRFCD